MKRIFLTSIATSILLVGACRKAPPQFSAQDATAVRALFDSVVADIRGGKLDSWAGRFSEDARFYPANSPMLAGRAAILAWGKTLPPMESFSFADVDVAGDGNLAYGSSRVFLKMKGVPADSSKQLVVFRRDANGRWWVQACAVSTDLPMPTSAAPASPRVRS